MVPIYFNFCKIDSLKNSSLWAHGAFGQSCVSQCSSSASPLRPDVARSPEFLEMHGSGSDPPLCLMIGYTDGLQIWSVSVSIDPPHFSYRSHQHEIQEKEEPRYLTHCWSSSGGEMLCIVESPLVAFAVLGQTGPWGSRDHRRSLGVFQAVSHVGWFLTILRWT